MSSHNDEAVVSRVIRLNQLILGKGGRSFPDCHHVIHRDGLLDALFALFDECNTKHMKKNPHVSMFVDKVKLAIDELQAMRVGLNDFEFKKIIGRGNFGEVQVVREKATGDVYAMKVLKKAETLAHQSAAFYEEERDIMAKSTSPWITKLQYAFQDPQNLYLIMEFHPGGDMLTLLEKYTVLSDEMARFYLAELVLAIHSVHMMGYAHRDIKPDNILIDRTGHIKLADFGSASKLDSNKQVTSKMPVGTPDYIAPEVLIAMNDGRNSKKGYGSECDWWSFGIVAYEMLFGSTPFAHEKLLIVYNNIMNFKKSLKFPDDASEVSESFIDLIKRVLTDAEQRMSYEELLTHQLFADIDWNNIRQSVPPYVPTVTGQDDTSNFDDFDQDIRPSMGDLQVKKEFTGKDLPFIGFTYISPFESLAERTTGIDFGVNSPSSPCDFERISKRKSLIQLQDKLAVMTANEESMKSEIQKLQSSMRKRGRKYESEICRLEDEIIALLADKKELVRLLRLEREDRVLTEKKASQILKCMKKRKRKSFQPAQPSRGEKGEGDGCNLSLLEQLEEALVTLEKETEICDFSSTRASLSSELMGKSSVNDISKSQSQILIPATSDYAEKLINTTQPFQPVFEKTDEMNFELNKESETDHPKDEQKQKVIAKREIAIQTEQVVVTDSDEHNSSPERLACAIQCSFARLEDKSQQVEGNHSLFSEEIRNINESTVMRIEQENSELISKVSELQEKIKELEAVSELEKNKDRDLGSNLKKKDDKIAELELDMRLLNREKKRADEILTTLRESNREFREQVKVLEKEAREKERSEETLKEKIKELEAELVREKQNIAQKTEMYEIDKAKLKERITALQEIWESQKDIGHIYAKNQGEFVQIAKENEKLKWESNLNETERSRLQAEIESLKKELAAKKQDCSGYEKVINALKRTCTELEEQLKEFEFLEKNWEAELKMVESEKKKLGDRVVALQGEITMKNSSLLEEKRKRENLEQQLAEMAEDSENQQSVLEAEVLTLNDQVLHQKKVIANLESHITEMEKEMSLRDRDTNVCTRKTMSLEDELVQVKEESAKYITQISSLKSSNLKLTQALEDAAEHQANLQNTIDQLRSALESSEAQNNHEKVKMHETISQQAKLIDFLQSKAELMEKKKKGLLVPRLFGRKENPGTSSWQNVEGLEQERTRCRRLQDQLSQARAENLALKNELSQHAQKTYTSQKNSVPVSPASREVHSALTASPTSNNGRASMTSHGTANKFMKLQGMKHRIPHRFIETLCMRGSKCAACLDSIHFGRPAAKCQECAVLCHTRCASSLPNTCGLPSGFMQHFKSAFNENADVPDSLSLSSSKVEGWIKVPKSSKQGWERRYLRIVGSVLFLFEDSSSQDESEALDHLDFAAEDGEIIVLSAVSPTELLNAAKSDLPFLLKIEYRPHTTCWPSRCLYLMADSFTDKQMWVTNLEALVEKYKKQDDQALMNRLVGKELLKLQGDSFMDVLCTFIINENNLLIGAVEGLFVVSCSNGLAKGKLEHQVEGIESVYQLALVNDIGLVVLISGEERNLSVMKFETLKKLIQEKSHLRADHIQCVSDIKDCHLFAVQDGKSDGTCHLCCATAASVILFRWDNNENTFCKRKVIMTKEPCSCILFTKSSVIYGSDKFYELDLKNCTLEEFLDCTDASLAGLIYGVSHFRSFPISVFNVSPVNQPDEYLVCFHELGVFVDGFGQRTRPDDMKWSRLPLSFAYQAPYLFVTHFNSLEVVEILPRGKTDKGVHSVMEIPNPQYLGPASLSGAIYIASCRDQTVEILCIEGSNSQNQQPVSEQKGSVSSSRNQSSCSKESCDDDLDFSFSNSLISSLDAASGDNLSVSSLS